MIHQKSFEIDPKTTPKIFLITEASEEMIQFKGEFLEVNIAGNIYT
jgi:hypothetical protein